MYQSPDEGNSTYVVTVTKAGNKPRYCSTCRLSFSTEILCAHLLRVKTVFVEKAQEEGRQEQFLEGGLNGSTCFTPTAAAAWTGQANT